jgi:hypothetical protein
MDTATLIPSSRPTSGGSVRPIDNQDRQSPSTGLTSRQFCGPSST